MIAQQSELVYYFVRIRMNWIKLVFFSSVQLRKLGCKNIFFNFFFFKILTTQYLEKMCYQLVTEIGNTFCLEVILTTVLV